LGIGAADFSVFRVFSDWTAGWLWRTCPGWLAFWLWLAGSDCLALVGHQAVAGLPAGRLRLAGPQVRSGW
jgi:hypothetical protein